MLKRSFNAFFRQAEFIASPLGAIQDFHQTLNIVFHSVRGNRLGGCSFFYARIPGLHRHRPGKLGDGVNPACSLPSLFQSTGFFGVKSCGAPFYLLYTFCPNACPTFSASTRAWAPITSCDMPAVCGVRITLSALRR